jgi:hypothetical protein
MRKWLDMSLNIASLRGSIQTRGEAAQIDERLMKLYESQGGFSSGFGGYHSVTYPEASGRITF